MANVVAFVPDLLFGSNVQGALAAGGHHVELVAAPAGLEPALRADGVDILVLDLTDAAEQRLALLGGLRRDGVLATIKTLAFYSHVEAEVRGLAEAAGVDLTVPRSRMHREGAALVARLAAG